jgi:site-specific recombinase XerD
MNTNTTVLALTVNGFTVKPELARPHNAKRNGHAVMLRVRKEGKDVAYLPTELFTMPAGFDSVTKQLKDATDNKMLTTLVARAGKVLATVTNAEQLKISWAKERKLIGQESFVDTMNTFDDWTTLTTLYRKRDELEKELGTVLAAIRDLEKQEGVTPLPTVSLLDANEYEKAVKEFTLTLASKSKTVLCAYRYVFESIAEYATFANVAIGLQSFDYQFYIGYAKFMLYQKDNFNNSFGAKIKKVKEFLHYCEDNGYKVNPGFKDKRFKTLTEEKLVTYLDDAELEMIWNYKQVNPLYNKVIDLMMFQSLTGLRVSDLQKRHMLVTKRGEKFVTGICKKNEGTFLIPVSLDPRIEEILNTYSLDMKILSEAYYNRTMKQVIADVYAANGLDMPEITYTRMKLNEKIQVTKPKHALISSHSMRRGFCTRNLNSGHFNETDILQMLGSSDLKELQKYITVESMALTRKATESAQSRKAAVRKSKIAATA